MFNNRGGCNCINLFALNRCLKNLKQKTQNQVINFRILNGDNTIQQQHRNKQQQEQHRNNIFNQHNNNIDTIKIGYVLRICVKDKKLKIKICVQLNFATIRNIYFF